MTSSHTLALAEESALTKLHRFLEDRRKEGPAADFEAFERELHEVVAAVEREGLAEELARQDVDVPAVVIDGVAHRRVLRCEEEYFGAAGPVRVMRTLYSTRAEGERTVCPMELKAGVIEGRWTPLAAKQAAWVVAHLTPQEGENLFRQLGGMTPSKSSLDRLPKQLGARWESQREVHEAALRAAETVPHRASIVAVSIDGVLVPMKDGSRKAKREHAAEAGKETRGPAGYREAGCATLSLFDDDRERLRTVRLARMPERKKVTLKGMLKSELDRVLSENPDIEIVKLADGARDNWEYMAKELPSGWEVVDFYHATEHLARALAAAYGETSPKMRAQFDRLRRVLLEERRGAAKVLRALRHLRNVFPRRKVIAQETAYFRRNQKRMRYAEMTDRGLPIGSGVVEAACKTLVTQRMKRSGMRWRTDGGQAILTLRALVQSERFEGGWHLLATTYKRAVTLPGNVVPFEPKRS